MRQTEIAYLAGVLDSDGTIGVKRSTYAVRVTKDSHQPSYSERIHIRQVERQALDLFSALFGGSVSVQPAATPNRKPLFRWGLTDRKAATALRVLLPHLRIKRLQANNCLRLREVKERSKKQRVAKGRGHVGSSPRSPENSTIMEALYQEAKRLNHVGA